jgi:hypothetical protein
VVLSRGSSAERFHAALGSTGLVPGAEEARSPGLHRVGGARRDWLPGSPGRFYWVAQERRRRARSIGTFNEGRKVTLWAGVSPRTSPRSPSRGARRR